MWKGDSSVQQWVSLSAFTLLYIVGELSHFLLGIVSRPMSQEIQYGDKGCLANKAATDLETSIFDECHTANNSDSCDLVGAMEGRNISACVWDFSGLGIEYQILAGPSFIAVFTISGVLIAMISDRYSRRVVVTVCLGILTGATILSGMANAFWQLVILRMLIGAGESAFSPACSSMISDIFDKDKQGLAMGLFNWGIYFGYGISYLIGNFVTSANYFNLGWRASYLISGVIGVVACIYLLIVVKEPARKEATPTKTEDDQATDQSDFSTTKLTDLTSSSASNLTHGKGEGGSELDSRGLFNSIFRGEAGLLRVLALFLNPSVIVLIVAACVRHTAGFTWAYNTQLYFSTYYPSFNLGIWISVVSIVGGSVGVVIGGFVSDRLVKRLGIKARLYVLAASQMAAAPFAVGVLYLAPPGAFFSLLGSYLFAEMWMGVLFAVLLDIFPSKVHSTAIAVFLFIMNNIGGNMPVMVEPLRNLLSYRVALLIMYPGNYILSAVLFFLASFLIRNQR